MPKDVAVWVADVGSVSGRKLGWCGGPGWQGLHSRMRYV
jgi:hypothetical protein